MRLSRLVTRHNRLILLFAALLVLPALYGITKTAIEYNVLEYLPKDLSSMRGEEILDRDFGDASSAIAIVEGRSIRALLDLKAKIAAVPGVRNVVGIDDVVDPSIPIEVLPAEVRSGFFSEKGSLLIIRFVESSGSMLTQEAILKIREVLGPDSYLSSVTAANIDSRSLSAKEMPLYLGLAVGLVTLILGLAMESWLIPLIFLLEIGLAIIFNLGTNFPLHKISFLSQALAAVLQLGVTMDFSIFLLHRYDEERGRYEDRREAMAVAIEKTFASISGSALTDIAGFMALCVMNLGLGFDIGVVMSKGVLIGLIGVVTILPAMILSFDGAIHKLSHKPVMFSFRKLSAFVAKRHKPLVLVFLLLFVPAFYGRDHTVQDYDLTGGIPGDMPSAMAEKKLRTDFNMVTTHFIIIRDNLAPAAVRDMIARFEKLDGVSGVIAIEKYLGALIPEEFLPEDVISLTRSGGKEIMIVNSIYNISMPEERKQLDEIQAIVKNFDPEGLVTGEGALAKELVSVAAEDFKRVDIVSISAIFIIVLFLFTSLSMPVLLVGAIELAIIINLGFPFYLGQSISFLSTIVIGCIQLGCTIDYSILLVSRFKEELLTGLGRQEAMREALRKAAPSILTSALILSSATAGVAFVSSLSLLKSICTLISRGALISMCVVFFLLPAILIFSEKAISMTSFNWRQRYPWKK
jgi:predicted RND superfamily exporter protein